MSRFEQIITVGLVLAHLVLAAIFSLGPIFEGPDEIEHYRYVRYLVRERALPPLDGQMRGEMHHAPLYYLLAAPVLAPFDDDDFTQIEARRNPFYPGPIDQTGSDNKNLYLHARAERFPYSGSETARAVHVLRLLSVVFSDLTVLISAAVFRLLWPDRPDRRVLALALVAFWPQLLFIGSVISNDGLLNLLATLVLWLLLRQLRSGPTRRSMALLGLALGALLLTKVSATFIALPVALAVLPDRRAWRHLPLMALLIVLVAGWWYARNWIEYGDPTGTYTMLRTWAAEVIRPGTLALDVGLERLPYAYESVWARFGQGAVAVPAGLYTAFDLFLVMALGGVLIRLGVLAARRAGNLPPSAVRQAIIVTVFAGVWVAALLYVASSAWSGNQGRYLLPGIAAWAAIFAWGLDAFTPRRTMRLRWPVALGLGAILGAVAVVCLFGCFLPAYRPVPASGSASGTLAYTFEGYAALTGSDPATLRAYPGDRLTLTLTWSALRPADRDLRVYLHSVESDVVRRDSYPATGNLLAPDWRAGETWAEQYVIDVPADAVPGHVFPLVAGLYDPATGRALEAQGPDGTASTPIIGRVAINRAPDAIDPAYTFADGAGDLFSLSQPQITRTGAGLEVCMQWRAGRITSTDYLLFVHVLDASGSPLTQFDGPAGNDYPSGAWARGEVVAQCVALDAPDLPADARIALGLYTLQDFSRLAVRPVNEQYLPDDRIVLNITGP
ncbi:MAG: DUF2142 domain-containing protein [Chloroflexi bacterium]|nr:DUF2142 domain-containing protein [Chloroflexota bacterium]